MDDMDTMDYEEESSSALFWSMKLEAGKPQEIDQPSIPGYIVHVTNACFGPSVTKQSRTVVMVNPSADSTNTDDEAPICVLRQGQHENQQLDLLFNESATISLKGQKPSTVYLTGYLQPPVSDELDPTAEDMDEADLEEMLRQQAMQAAELDGEDDQDGYPEQEGEDEEDVDDEEEEAVEPPSKKQKTEKGSQNTKAANGSPKKRKSPLKKPKQEVEDEDEDDVDTEAQQTQMEEEETKMNTDDGKNKKKKDKKGKKMQNMKGGIKYRDMKVGNGKTVSKGDNLTVYYVGQLDDKKVFDKSISGDGFQFELGAGNVIKGWDMGLKGMKVGGKRKLVIPAKLAYGANGSPPAVPPNAQLTFTIEIKSAK